MEKLIKRINELAKKSREEGPHGILLANETTAGNEEQIRPEVEGWIDMSIGWIKSI